MNLRTGMRGESNQTLPRDNRGMIHGSDFSARQEGKGALFGENWVCGDALVRRLLQQKSCDPEVGSDCSMGSGTT